jgi:hypothetical protein
VKDYEKITSKIANQGHVCQCKKGLDDIILIQRVFEFFFKMSISSGIFLSNPHILILDGHVSHVTLEAIEWVH